MKHTFTHNGQTYELELTPTPDGFRLAYQGQEHHVTGIEVTPERVRFKLDGVNRTLAVARPRDTVWVAIRGRAYPLKKQARSRRRGPAGEANPEGVLRAPMPGQVRSVQVSENDRVQKGDTLLILEAMKMEIRIQTPCDGTVAQLPVQTGDQVDKDQVLVVVGEEDRDREEG